MSAPDSGPSSCSGSGSGSIAGSTYFDLFKALSGKTEHGEADANVNDDYCMFNASEIDKSGCKKPRACDACLRVVGCMVNSTGYCVSAALHYNASLDFRAATLYTNTTLSVQSSYDYWNTSGAARSDEVQNWIFPSTTVGYCPLDDASCKLCFLSVYQAAASPDNRFCVGANGCVCSALCDSPELEAAQDRSAVCDPSKAPGKPLPQSLMWVIGSAAALLVCGLLYLWVWRRTDEAYIKDTGSGDLDQCTAGKDPWEKSSGQGSATAATAQQNVYHPTNLDTPILEMEYPRLSALSTDTSRWRTGDWTPDLMRMLESVGDEKKLLARQADADLVRTTQQIEAHKQKAVKVAETGPNAPRDWTAVYDKWDAWQDPEELAQREQDARDKQTRANKAAAAAGCNHDHSAEQQLMDMTTRAKLDACDAFRVLGNRFFAQGQYQRAAYHYHKALVYFEYIFPDSPDDEAELTRLQLTTRLNFAACRLKTGHLDDALHHADLVLESDATNIKALYRRAQAYRLRDDFDKALADITAALACSEQQANGASGDPLLVQEKQLLQAKMLAYKCKSKQLSVAMFGGPSTSKANPELVFQRGVSSVKDVPLRLSTSSVVGVQDNQSEWRLDETYRPSTAGLTELAQWLETL